MNPAGPASTGMQDRPPDALTAEPRQGESPDSDSMTESLARWLQATGTGLATSFRLAIAEAKLAAMSLVWMLFLTVLAAIFALGAWGLMLSGGVIALDGLGVPTWASLLGLGVLQVLAAVILFRAVLRLGERLELAETNRRLEALIGGSTDEHDR